MNKLTLSAAALTAIVAPVQVQAADGLTGEEKKKAIEALREQLNAAANKITNEAKDVQEKYLRKLSETTIAMNEAYEKPGEPLDPAMIASWSGTIQDALKEALAAQEPYTTKAELSKLFKELETLYNSQLLVASNTELYPKISATKVTALKNIGVETLGEEIKALDPKDADSVDKAKGDLFDRIEEYTVTIENLTKDLLGDEKAAGEYTKARSDFESEYTTIKSKYNEELQRAISALPTEIECEGKSVYDDLQKKAVEELNEQYRILNEAKKVDDKLFEAIKAVDDSKNITAYLENNTRKDDISPVLGRITVIVDKYEDIRIKQDQFKSDNQDKLDSMKEQLESMKRELKKRDLKDCDVTIGTTEGKIETMQKTINSQYIAHNLKAVTEYDYGSIQEAIDGVSDISTPPYSYAEIIANYDAAYDSETGMQPQVDAEKLILDTNVETAKTLSEDGKYNAADRFKGDEGDINGLITSLTTEVTAYYNDKRAVVYNKGNIFSGKLQTIQKKNENYSTNTNDALIAYNTATKKIIEAKAKVDELADFKDVEAGIERIDLNATIDGTVTGETYRAVINRINADINAIDNAIKTACNANDADHLTKIKDAANKKIYDLKDVDAITAKIVELKDGYINNKNNFDKNSAINTANAVVEAFGNRIGIVKKSVDEVGADEKLASYGVLGAEIQDAITQIRKALVPLESAYTTASNTAKNNFGSTAEDEKQKVATKTIEVLSKNNAALEDVEKALADLEKTAQAAVANNNAYQEVLPKVDDAQQAIDNVEADLNQYPDGSDVKNFYLGKLKNNEDALQKKLNGVNANLNSANTNGKMVEEKENLVGKFTQIITAANELKQDIADNKIKYDYQSGKADELQPLWNTAYETISDGDLSDKAAEYLQKLAKLQEDITDLINNTIPTAYGKGESAAQDREISDQITAITDGINDITKESQDEYNKHLNEANQAQHDVFTNKEKTGDYDVAYETYGAAVLSLNKFSTITNDAVKTAIQELTDVHAGIYGYANVLRKLFADEAADFNSHPKHVEYGEANSYDSQTWCDEANRITNDIKAKIAQYQQTVNTAAYYEYKDKVRSIDIKLGRMQTLVNEQFIYVNGNAAFSNVISIVNAIKSACSIGNDGSLNFVDPEYAVNMDNWLRQLEKVDDMLKQDYIAAQETEMQKRLEAINKLYKDELADITAWDNIAAQDGYIQKLKELKVSTIDVAEASTDFDDVIASCDGYAQYSKEGDKYILGNSQVWTEAHNIHVFNQENQDAYDRMIGELDLIESEFNTDIRPVVEQLLVAHQNTKQVDPDVKDTYTLLNEIAKLLEPQRDGIENWKEMGMCKEMESLSTLSDDYLDLLNELKIAVVRDEYNTLVDKIDAVKEQYNNYAKIDLENAKPYEKKIGELFDYKPVNAEDTKAPGLKQIKEKYDNILSNDPDNAYGMAIEQFASKEEAIAKLNHELNQKWDADNGENSQIALAKAVIDKKVAEAADAVKDATKWANYSDATRAFAEADVKSLSDRLEAVTRNYGTWDADNKLLFYKNNIIFDLENVLNDTPKAGSELECLYKKHELNDEVFTEVEKAFGAEEDALGKAYGAIKDFDNKNCDFEAQKQTISNYIAQKKQTWKMNHDDVLLTSTNGLDSDIKFIHEFIDDFERSAKVYQAATLIGIQKEALDKVKKVKDARKYAPERSKTLNGEYQRIESALKNALSYNYDAAGYDDSIRDYIKNNIDGTPVSDNGGEIKCDYKSVAWGNLMSRIDELTKDVENFDTDVENYSYEQGDVDRDGEVTVNDYSEVRNFILNAQNFNDIHEAKAWAADLNGDLDINVADLTGMSNILLHGQWDWNPASNGAKKTRAKVSAEDEINISNEGEETTIFGKTVRMAVNLAHSEAFTSGQMDITMPQGMKIVGQSMSDRANGHDIFANDLGNGVTRLLTATIDNNEFNGRNGALIYLDVEVSSDFSGGQISIDNIIFSDAAGRMYTMSSIGGNGDGATGIDGIKAATVKERIYSVGGQMMKAVKKGINIIVGEDGKARKIVNK